MVDQKAFWRFATIKEVNKVTVKPWMVTSIKSVASYLGSQRMCSLC